jgi:hypothetical protein
MRLFLEVVQGTPPAGTYDTRSCSCWESFKRLLEIADKFDFPVVRERAEKWLVSRCLQGSVKCSDFKFQDVQVGLEWLALCEKYALRDLGWFIR